MWSAKSRSAHHPAIRYKWPGSQVCQVNKGLERSTNNSKYNNDFKQSKTKVAIFAKTKAKLFAKIEAKLFAKTEA